MPEIALKPRQLRQQQNRRNILDAALEMISEEGIEALSLRKVAARSHFSPAGLYEYFANKSAIISALCQEVDNLLANYLRGVTASPDPVAHLVEIGMGYIAFATENPKEYQLMHLLKPEGREADTSKQESAFDILYNAVLQLGSHTSPMDTQAFAYACWSFVHGLASLENQLQHAFAINFAATQRAALQRFISH